MEAAHGVGGGQDGFGIGGIEIGAGGGDGSGIDAEIIRGIAIEPGSVLAHGVVAIGINGVDDIAGGGAGSIGRFGA